MGLGFIRRAAAVACSVALLVPADLRAAPVTALQQADDLNREAIELRREAEALTEGAAARPAEAAARLEQAAQKWREAALLLPPDAREARHDLYCDAIAAWQQAHALAPARVQALRDALALSETFAREPPLARACSPEDHVRRLREAIAATEPRPAPRQAPRPDAPALEPRPAPAPKPAGPSRGLKIGLWTSLGLTIAWGAVAAGTGVAVAHGRAPRDGVSDPGDLFMGPAYRRVFDEARALGLQGARVDLCAASSFAAAQQSGGDPSALQDACGAFARTRDAALAGAALAGVSLVATAVFTGLVLRRRARASGRVSVLGGPLRGGASLGVGLRF